VREEERFVATAVLLISPMNGSSFTYTDAQRWGRGLFSAVNEVHQCIRIKTKRAEMRPVI
jgi:hypothetical protein